jgi:YYY domain-containing protein
VILDLLLWLAAVEVAAVAVLPLALRVFKRLPDSGFAFSKPLGLLLLTYLLWAPAMLGYLRYERTTLVVLIALIALGCWTRYGQEAARWLRARRQVVLVEQGIFLAAGVAGLFVRAYNPDIVGQEKFMDLAFFNGFLAASSLPAEDSWLAGYAMPYYPFGYLLFSVPTELAGLPPPLGYNLALVLVLALTVLLSSSLAANLLALLRAPREGVLSPDRIDWSFGLLSATFVAICGNLVGPLEILAARGFGGSGFWSAVGVKNLQAAVTPAGWLPSDGTWWWHAARVIATIQPDGITEFPYFSFLLGDLHPHFTALPLLLLISGLALALLLEGAPRCEPEWLGVTGLALGVSLAANTWDLATFWLLYGLAALVVWTRQAGADRQRLAGLLLPIPLGIVLFLPYLVGYTSQSLGLGRVSDATPFVSLLILFGPMLLLTTLLGVRLLSTLDGTWTREARLLAGVALIAAIGMIALDRGTAALAVVLLTLMAMVGSRLLVELQKSGSARLAALLYLVGLVGVSMAVLLGTELIYIRDSFGTRMNTVFKFYYHVWLLLGLAAGPACALWLVKTNLPRPRLAIRAPVAVLSGCLLGLGLVYPLAATWTKSNSFRGPATLDGAAFLERSKPGDAAGIRWLRGRPGRPVVLEAFGGDYEEFARVSTFSGLPTVLGWVGHELQWRGQLEEYGRRQQDIETVYRQGNAEVVLPILERYRVSYVFVGTLEREKYGVQVDQALGRWLTPVFRRESTVIFEVPRADDER